MDTSCDRDDPKCVKKAVEKYKGDGNILICWQHEALTDIVKKLGAKDAPEYPSDRYGSPFPYPFPSRIESTTIEMISNDSNDFSVQDN